VVPACRGLAELYRQGLGVDKDQARALAILDKACDGDEASCCSYLGLIYVEGLDVPYDRTHQLKGTKYYEKACGLGSSGACWHLGHLYLSGAILPADAKKGHSLIQKACDSGDSVACGELDEKPGDKHP
jgi:TPR repeat protein